MRVLFVLSLFFLTTLAVPSQAEEAMAQRWLVLEEGSGLIHQATGQTPQARMQHYATEIHFAPDMLDTSSFLISFSFTPPGQAATADSKLEGYFESSSVTRKDKATFLAKGTLNVLGSKQPMVLMFSPSFIKDTDPPRMLFDGSFAFQPRAFVSGAAAAAFPSEMTVQFRFLAEPL